MSSRIVWFYMFRNFFSCGKSLLITRRGIWDWGGRGGEGNLILDPALGDPACGLLG